MINITQRMRRTIGQDLVIKQRLRGNIVLPSSPEAPYVLVDESGNVITTPEGNSIDPQNPQ